VDQILSSIPLLGLYEIIPGFVLACVVIFVVSLMGRPTSSMVSNFDKTSEDYMNAMKS